MRKAAIALLVLFGIPAILIGFDEFKHTYPTELLCGQVISTYAAAIEAAAQSLRPEARYGLTPSVFAKNCGGCSADLNESMKGDWMVSMNLPAGQCGRSKEVLIGVRTCGGASWIMGSMPSSPEGDLCTTCTDLRVPPEPGCS